MSDAAGGAGAGAGASSAVAHGGAGAPPSAGAGAGSAAAAPAAAPVKASREFGCALPLDVFRALRLFWPCLERRAPRSPPVLAVLGAAWIRIYCSQTSFFDRAISTVLSSASRSFCRPLRRLGGGLEVQEGLGESKRFLLQSNAHRGR